MNNYDEQFIDVFNEHYPFERYIVKEPKSINNLFDDALLTEIFIPHTEIKPILNDDNTLSYWTKVNEWEIYVKLKTKAGEIRMVYMDFNEHIREEIRHIIYTDFGGYEWECLYVDYEDIEDLNELIKLQEKLIKEKYKTCNIKKNTSYYINQMNSQNNI